CLLHSFSRHSRVDRVALHHCPRQDHRACCDHRAFMKNRIVHDDSSHTYQYVVMNGAPMNHCIMGDRDITTYISSRLEIGTVNDGAILDIGVISDADLMHITAD